MFAAPGSEITSLSSYNNLIGPDDEDIQAANDLSKRYLPLARKIARSYGGRGISDDDLRSAAELGLTLGSRKFDPNSGAFGPYVSFWIKGEITKLFKPSADAFSRHRVSLTVHHNDDERSHQRDVADQAPTIAPDLSALSERERDIIEARASGETLSEIGKEFGVSAERIRQLEARALPKIKGGIASACISDLTQRGKVIRFPIERTRHYAEFRDREPPKHIYQEPIPTRQLLHHRKHAPRLAALRGNEPLRNPKGPYGGPVIHGWGRP
jgi:RNA polymerase sigma factor (sigma-70 family)